jgi:hypothetical protein
VAQLTVRPEHFQAVLFEHAEVVAIAEHAVSVVGFDPTREIVVEIDERTVLGRVRITSLEPVTIVAESGALEDPKRPRKVSHELGMLALGKALFRASDRISGRFDDAPADDRVGLRELAAWDVYAAGRCARAGITPPRQRHLYGFRNRHGFSDATDVRFEELWNADGLSWADVIR